MVALQTNGLKIMILLRLSPLIPYNALDYMSGITAIPLWAYSLALIGLLPGTISLCIIGASASSITDGSASENKVLQIVTVVAGVFFAASGVFLGNKVHRTTISTVGWIAVRVTSLFVGCPSPFQDSIKDCLNLSCAIHSLSLDAPFLGVV